MKEENKRDFIVHLAEISDMPPKIHGCASPSSENEYNVYINGALTEAEKTASFIHEMLHIYNNDFYRDTPAEEIEQNIHNQLREALKILSE